jgi:rRNA maturation endonuclease Nob1
MLAVLSLKRNLDRTTLTTAGERKPVEGKCPICFHGFETSQKTTWCQSCGSNFHKACFKKWEAAMRTFYTVVSCLYW